MLDDIGVRIVLATRKTETHFLEVLFAMASSMKQIVLSLLTSVSLVTSAVPMVYAQEPMKEEKPKMEAKAEPEAPEPGKVTVTGLLDGYYQINYQRPAAAPAFAAPVAGVNATRAFDYRNNFGFSLGEVNISRTPGKGLPIGITSTFTIGDTPPVVYFTEPGGRVGYEGIQQLYITYTPKFLNRDWTIDFGKFVTHTGYEVIESSGNDNYSRGLLFTYAIPFYHTGFRITTPIAPGKLNLMFGVTNGWNNSRDDNNAKTISTQLTWTPSKNFTGYFNYLGGAEGQGAYGVAVGRNGAGSISTNVFQFIPVWNVTDKLKLAGDLVYANGAGTVRGTRVSGNWFGMAAYARYQLTPQFATAIRSEQFEDIPGRGTLPGATAGGLRFAAGYAKVRSFTVTLEYAAFNKSLITRLEYRHDRASQSFGAIGPDQDTLTLGQVYKF